MSQKRMFSKKIIDSGMFLEMPLSTQCLYFHLNMRADDEGVVDNVRQIMRMIGANEDDIKTLLAKAFILIVDGEVIVIKDWYIHNTLKNDRTEESLYHNQLNTIYSINENKQYTKNGNILETKRNHRLDKISIDKISIDKIRLDKDNNNNNNIPTYDKIESYCKEKGYEIDIEDFIHYWTEKGWKRWDKNLKKYVPIKDIKGTIRTWAKNEKRYEEDRQVNIGSKKAYIKDVEYKTKPKETAQQRDDRNLKKLVAVGEKMLKEWNDDNTRNSEINKTNKNALTDNSDTET